MIIQCYISSIADVKTRFSFVLGEKYEAVSTDSGYNKYMMLKIRSASKGDFGSYKCVAKNSLGETDGVIKLDGKLSIFSVQQPPVGQALLIHDVSRSHTTTHHRQ